MPRVLRSNEKTVSRGRFGVRRRVTALKRAEMSAHLQVSFVIFAISVVTFIGI